MKWERRWERGSRTGNEREGKERRGLKGVPANKGSVQEGNLDVKVTETKL